MQFDLKKNLIALHLKGSQSYGLATESSDFDLGGVFVPTREYLFGYSRKMEQTEDVKSLESFYKDKIDISKGVEGTIFEIRKFINLASAANPNMMEILWIEDSDFFVKTPAFEKIQEIKNSFLSTRVRFTYTGYAFAQVRRIVSHRSWIKNPVLKKPERTDFDLPDIRTSQYDAAEDLIKNQIDHWAFHDLDLSPEVTDAVKQKIKEQLAYSLVALGIPDVNLYDNDICRKAAMNKIGFDDNMCIILEKEHKYRNELKNYQNYIEWKKNRNPERAKMEEKYGYDCKHACQVVRLCKMGKEILSTGKVIVKRKDDREELLSIRNGAWSYDQLLEYAENMQKELETLYKTSPLKKSPDINKIEEVCIDIIEEHLRNM
jgi:hypothetical protein